MTPTDDERFLAAQAQALRALPEYLRPSEQAIAAMQELGIASHPQAPPHRGDTPDQPAMTRPALYAEIDRLRAELAEARAQQPDPTFAIVRTGLHGNLYRIHAGYERMLDPEGLYFTMRLDTDKAAQSAIQTYADAIMSTDPVLGWDLITMLQQMGWGNA